MELLKRQIGLWGAVWLGLGSILGTGVFVSIAVATQVAGKGVLVGILLASLIAICNGLNSAQLAASHPISGGTYEYGYRYLHPWCGFIAGWLFLLAKSASAATAALGVSAYLARLGVNVDPRWLGLIAVALMTGVVFLGVKRSGLINTVIVSMTLLALLCFIALGFGTTAPQSNIFNGELMSTMEATALMFVAYAGYARITTLGEEVVNPRRTIPWAVGLTIAITSLLYLGVGIVGIKGGISQVLPSNAPLADLLNLWGYSLASKLVIMGAISALLGVLLNLILGLSRIVLAMARRGDLPGFLAQLNREQTTPPWAVVTVGTAIALLTLIGNVKTTWSFSAFHVLNYYAITNLCAWQLNPRERMFPRWLAGVGLLACAILAFFVDRQVWLTGLGLLSGLSLVYGLTRRIE
ncbi:MAG: amino acid permease [Pseudanabaenaceae cyanobacterium SKYGB_i_bin29]|nr:amino acid permease [Pseudanabaenaceae cyanobacterium SKYG29]MDW8421963.1 amino acid permease [Pseudanabaenaceae cyanobacterium SKYGB_i_bin29]